MKDYKYEYQDISNSSLAEFSTMCKKKKNVSCLIKKKKSFMLKKKKEKKSFMLKKEKEVQPVFHNSYYICIWISYTKCNNYYGTVRAK